LAVVDGRDLGSAYTLRKAMIRCLAQFRSTIMDILMKARILGFCTFTCMSRWVHTQL